MLGDIDKGHVSHLGLYWGWGGGGVPVDTNIVKFGVHVFVH